MAKAKTFEEAQEQFNAAKEALKDAKTVLREFTIENKIKKDKAPEDPKLASKFEKLNKAVEKAREDAEAAKEAVKELKPKKVRETKYEYPEGMTDKEKKKYRAKVRRDKLAAEKPPKEAKEPKEKKPLKKSKGQEEGNDD